MQAARAAGKTVDGVELVRWPGTEPMPQIPQTHIVCTNTLPHRDPTRMRGRIWDIDTGHDLMISEPQAVADHLQRVPTA